MRGMFRSGLDNTTKKQCIVFSLKALKSRKIQISINGEMKIPMYYMRIAVLPHRLTMGKIVLKNAHKHFAPCLQKIGARSQTSRGYAEDITVYFAGNT